jgi:hypothetical protein
MTDQEHGEVSRLASIMLLGFLLPHSTGNEFFLLQNLSSRHHRRSHQQQQSAGSQTSENTTTNTTTMEDYVLHMPLQERLESIAQIYRPEDFGELDTIVPEHIDLAFGSFLKRALHPILSSRPAHSSQVDLLHILAMAIHPHPSEQPIRQTVAELEEKDSHTWSATKHLMTSLVPHSFHLHYRHRLQLVQLVADGLVLPDVPKDKDTVAAAAAVTAVSNNDNEDEPLFEGALPHLRASLYAFGMAAMSPYDAHWAQCGLVSVAIQTGIQVVVREEWGRLLHRLMDDRTNCHCCHDHNATTTTATIRTTTSSSNQSPPPRRCLSLMMSPRRDDGAFCPHRARGQLLERFLIKFSEARHYADASFLQHSLASLTDAIEWQVDCWTKSSSSEDDDDVEEEDDDDNNINNVEAAAAAAGEEQQKSSSDNEDAEGNDGDVKDSEMKVTAFNGKDEEKDSEMEDVDRKDSDGEEGDQKDGEAQDADGKSGEGNGDEHKKVERNDEDTKEKDGKGEESKKDREQTTSKPPCLLASLLLAAKPLFYFLLPTRTNADDKNEEETEDSHRRDMLVSCGIQLVHHWNSDIAKEASKLLVLAFCYGPDDMMTDYAGAVFESTKLALQEAFKDKGRVIVPVEGMVATFSQKSATFAYSLLSVLLSKDEIARWNLDQGGDDGATLVCRLVAAIATASPGAAETHLDKLVEEVENSETKNGARIHLMAALLACRQARFFNEGNGKVEQCIAKSISSDSHSGWNLYLLARHAMVTGNFGIAKDLYQRVVALPSSETMYLWLSSLQKVAEAEFSLSSNGAKGIPFATMQLRSAVSSFHTLPSFHGSSSADFAFQTRLLNLRLDFLDLLAGIRQLTREMRLTGVGPKKHTRPSLHLRNQVKFLNVLATKYLTLYRQFGLFLCQQSRTTLRTLHALCRFASSAARSAFIDELPETSMGDFQKNAIQALTLPKGDASHPLTILMHRLDSSVLKDMDGSVDAKIRAAAMLEIIDGILKAPSPFPRDFLHTKPVPRASLRLSVDSELLDEHGDAADDELDEEIDVSPGTNVTFSASGTIPESLLTRANLPFCIILLWHTVSFRGWLGGNKDEDKQDAEENKQDLESSSDIRSMSSASLSLRGGTGDPAPTAASLSSSGTFFMKVECDPMLEEGLYNIETRLGCRDIRGGEWELPLNESTPTICVRVSRSR